MREAFESEARKTGKDRLLITMAVPASLEYAGKVGYLLFIKTVYNIMVYYIFILNSNVKYPSRISAGI